MRTKPIIMEGYKLIIPRHRALIMLSNLSSSAVLLSIACHHYFIIPSSDARLLSFMAFTYDTSPERISVSDIVQECCGNIHKSYMAGNKETASSIFGEYFHTTNNIKKEPIGIWFDNLNIVLKALPLA